MTRTLVALALLAFAARQAVALTVCCCDSLCRNPNEPCGGHEHAPRPSSALVPGAAEGGPAKDDC